MKKLIAILMITFSLFIPVLSSVAVSAQFNPVGEACVDGDGNQIDSAVCKDGTDPGDPLKGQNNIFVRIANVIALVGGIIAVIVIIVAGITMMVSGGDSNKVQNSRDAIIYTTIGIVVIVLARTIVVFIINRVDT